MERARHRKAFGEAVRAYRKKAGFSQEKLAERAGLHHNFIGAVERAEMEISLSSMVKVARALGVRVRDLVRQV